MFDSGATVFFAIFMAFWGKLSCVTSIRSTSAILRLVAFPVLSLKHSKSPLFASNILYMCDKPIF